MNNGCVFLSEIDQYIKDIWVECCGHLSCFTIDGIRYERYPDDEWEETEEQNCRLTKYIRVKRALLVIPAGKRCNPSMRRYIFDMVNSPRWGVCGYEGPADDIMFMEHKGPKKGGGKKQQENKRRSLH